VITDDENDLDQNSRSVFGQPKDHTDLVVDPFVPPEAVRPHEQQVQPIVDTQQLSNAGIAETNSDENDSGKPEVFYRQEEKVLAPIVAINLPTDANGYHYDKPEVPFHQEEEVASVAPVQPTYLPPEAEYLPSNSS
jgi:hypothetical protein